MKLMKLLLALTILTSQTINAVWWNPFTWFCCEETETQHDGHCKRCN